MINQYKNKVYVLSSAYKRLLSVRRSCFRKLSAIGLLSGFVITGVAGQQFPRPVLPPGVGAHACHPWLRQCLLPVLYWAGCSPHVGLGLLIF